MDYDLKSQYSRLQNESDTAGLLKDDEVQAPDYLVALAPPKLTGSGINFALAPGSETVSGTSGNDRINSSYTDGDGNNINSTGQYVFAYAGNDTVYAGNGADQINGGLGDDVIFGLNGDDVINGSDGTDTIYGGNDNDTVYGGDGSDSLSGGSGDDWLYANEPGEN